MPSLKVTKSSIDAIRPSRRDELYWDERQKGFGVKVTPKGAKIFIFQYRLGGRGAKTRRYTIGPYGRLTVEDARKKVGSLALAVSNGLDPQREKIVARRKAVDLAFATYIHRFHEGCLKTEWSATHKYAFSLLTKYALPVIGDTPLPDISRKDVKAVLAGIASKTATASNMFAVLRRTFSWAVEQEDIERSPIEGMKPPPLPASRERVLADDELGLVWRAAETLGYPFGPMVHLLALTGARREEVAALNWSELNRDTRSWSLPARRSKNAKASENSLSDMAIEVLDGLAVRAGYQKGWPKQGLVFSTTGRTAASGHSRAKRRLDLAVTRMAEEEGLSPPEPWRLHDLRRTLATGLQRLGVRLEVTEAVLNHVSGSRSGIVGVYQRHNWKDEKQAALEAWARHLKKFQA